MILRCLFLGQLMVLSLLKGMGNAIMHVKEVKILLYELLDRRSQNSFGIGRSCEPLSNIETDTLCLLLEVSILTLSNICLNFFFSIFFFNLPFPFHYVATLNCKLHPCFGGIRVALHYRVLHKLEISSQRAYLRLYK